MTLLNGKLTLLLSSNIKEECSINWSTKSLTIGSSDNCDGCIHSKHVDELHCYLKLEEDGRAALCNAAQSNFITSVDGCAVVGSVILRHKSIMTIGNVRFRFEYPPCSKGFAGDDLDEHHAEVAKARVKGGRYSIVSDDSCSAVTPTEKKRRQSKLRDSLHFSMISGDSFRDVEEAGGAGVVDSSPISFGSKNTSNIYDFSDDDEDLIVNHSAGGAKIKKRGRSVSSKAAVGNNNTAKEIKRRNTVGGGAISLSKYKPRKSDLEAKVPKKRGRKPRISTVTTEVNSTLNDTAVVTEEYNITSDTIKEGDEESKQLNILKKRESRSLSNDSLKKRGESMKIDEKRKSKSVENISSIKESSEMSIVPMKKGRKSTMMNDEYLSDGRESMNAQNSRKSRMSTRLSGVKTSSPSLMIEKMRLAGENSLYPEAQAHNVRPTVQHSRPYKLESEIFSA